MRPHITLAAFALALASLTACGSGADSADSAYCKELKSDKTYFEAFGDSNPDFSKIDEAFDRMHSLANKAPDDVADDWSVLDKAFTSITTALKDAGISFADIGKMQQGKIPKGADPKKLAALGPKLQELSGAKFEKASKAIEKHAKDTCDVNLSAS
jgi:hypothetical protein